MSDYNLGMKLDKMITSVSINANGTLNAEQPREYRTLSSSVKPTDNIPLFSVLIEMDDTNDYYWNSTAWVLM